MPETVEFHAKALKETRRVLEIVDHTVRLSKIGTPEAVEALFHAACMGDNDKRSFARSAIANVRNPEAVPTLISCMKVMRPEVSVACGDALAEMGDIAMDPLIEALENDSPHFVQYSARALGKIGDEKALVPLMKITGKHHDDANNEIKKAIKLIQEANHGA